MTPFERFAGCRIHCQDVSVPDDEIVLADLNQHTDYFARGALLGKRVVTNPSVGSRAYVLFAAFAVVLALGKMSPFEAIRIAIGGRSSILLPHVKCFFPIFWSEAPEGCIKEDNRDYLFQRSRDIGANNHFAPNNRLPIGIIRMKCRKTWILGILNIILHLDIFAIKIGRYGIPHAVKRFFETKEALCHIRIVLHYIGCNIVKLNLVQ